MSDPLGGFPPDVYLQIVWGPGFIGMVVGMGLYGVTLAQTMFYYRAFPSDRTRLKLLVASLCLFDTIHVLFLIKLYWLVTINARFNYILLVLPWEMPASSITTYIITFIVQSFYSHRVWKLSGNNKVLTSIIVLFALVQLGAGSAFGLRQLSPTTEGPSGMNPNVYSGTTELVSSVLCDVCITGAMVYYLHTKRTDVRRSDTVLQKLIIYTVHVGLLGCIVAFVALVLFLVPLGIFLSAAPHFIVSKCYVNSLLATLNARRAFRQMFRDNMDGTYALPVLSNVEPLQRHHRPHQEEYPLQDLRPRQEQQV